MAQTYAPSTTQALTNAVLGDLLRRDGVLNDPSGGSLKVTAGGGSQNVTVAAGQASVRGGLYDNDAAVGIALSSTGLAAGQVRNTNIMLRVVTTGPEWTCSIVPKYGTPSTTGVPVPTISRDAAVHELALAMVRQVGPTAVDNSMITDLREWTSRTLFVPAGRSLGAEPIGTLAIRDRRVWARVILPNGDLEWTDTTGGLLDRVWGAVPRPIGYSQGYIRWRRVHGMATLAVSIRSLTASGTNVSPNYGPLPVGVLPDQQIPGTGLVTIPETGTTRSHFKLIVDADGRIEFQNLTIRPGDWATGTVTYPLA